MPSVRSAALSDIGRVRRENEDRFVRDPDALLFGVADGVGGLPGGAEAAELAIREITDGFKSRPRQTEPDLVKLVDRANKAVAKLGMVLSPAMGIGTTLTFGCIHGNTFQIAHVGDSRCYLGRESEFMRVTEDHSVENEARLRRSRGEVVHYYEANRNALTRCVGQPSRLQVDLVSRPLLAGDRYLFCTDGVTRIVPDSELAAMVFHHADPELALKDIVAAALTRGAPDNITAVLVYIDAV
jgi:protein phosphatase